MDNESYNPVEPIYYNYKGKELLTQNKEDDFDKIMINVEFENEEDHLFFKSRKYNSPKYEIRNQRSKTKEDYLQNFKRFNDNDWILFSPNNDHPNISNK